MQQGRNLARGKGERGGQGFWLLARGVREGRLTSKVDWKLRAVEAPGSGVQCSTAMKQP